VEGILLQIATVTISRLLTLILIGALTACGGSAGSSVSSLSSVSGTSGSSGGSAINGRVGSAEYGNFTSLTLDSAGLCSAGTTFNFTTTSNGWTWACQGSGGGSTDSSGSAFNVSPSTVSIAQSVKFSGCTFAGLIGTSDAGQEATGKLIAGTQLTLFNNYVDLISRSNCTYIGRAVDTWDWPPDFTAISANIAAFYEQLKTLSLPAGAPQNYVFGTYVAEHVSLTLPYYYDTQNRYFNFAAMCATPPAVGDTECLVSFNQPEYVDYVTYVLTRGIDLGLQVYLFGNAGLTDPQGTAEESNLVKIIIAMRAYASSKGMTLLFMAQDPSHSGGPAYFDNFDLIQGGAYINPNGTIPDTPIVTNKGAGNPAPQRLWMAVNNQGQPWYNPQKLVVEYDWFSNPIDDSSEVGCLSVNSQAYFDYLRSLSTANCPLGTMVGSAVPATTAIYNNLKSLGVGFWLPGRQRVAYPPFIYTPMNLTLAPGTPQATNFNDEGVLAIGAAQ
jgi:hypothetical protein